MIKLLFKAAALKSSVEGLRERSMNRSERKLGGPIKVIWWLVALRWENEGGAQCETVFQFKGLGEAGTTERDFSTTGQQRKSRLEA